ncbi:junctophilin-1 [Culex quinquefasciatus]|uniref:Junctophilin-1 n=1 Tax=Culex quinquefasciatus TaxID=7176 RepID=B0XIM5_CULQU|nr:junctophilin-1 [Culex quinquefasciatus]|eukprot:XP_001869497.1 junctophilin-1 [Culex quinquefasciatus]
MDGCHGVDHRMKDTGKTEKDMALALKPEADGFTEASGRKGLRDATVFDKAYHQQPDTKVHGPMVCRTATDQKHMQMEKADIAVSRTATARGKAELADVAADHARMDSDLAIQMAREFAPDFKPQLLERFERLKRDRIKPAMDYTVKQPPSVIPKASAGDSLMKPNSYGHTTNEASHLQSQPPKYNDVSSNVYQQGGYNNNAQQQQQMSNMNMQRTAARKMSQAFDRNAQQNYGNMSGLTNDIQNAYTNKVITNPT